MRVFFLAAASALTLLVTACSSAEAPLLRRNQSASEATLPERGANASTPGGSTNPTPAPPDDPAPPATTPPPAESTPATTPAPTPATPPPATTPPAGACGNPKCFAAAGLCGCKATDSQGDIVALGCQDGACGCFTGNKATAEGDAPCSTADEARALFIDSCGCQ